MKKQRPSLKRQKRSKRPKQPRKANQRISPDEIQLYPLENGRRSSAGPNLLNLAKRREDDYAPILGKLDDDKFIAIREAVLTAIHEAGHAVAAVHYGLPLEFVHIKRQVLPDGRVSVGYTKCPVPVPRGETEALPWIIQQLAGPIAEVSLDDDVDADQVMKAGAGDIDRAKHIAIFAICPHTIGPDGGPGIRSDVIAAHVEKLTAFFNAAFAAAHEFVEKFWDAINAVARALMVHRELTAEQVAAIMRDQQSADTPA
jgi:hypothetical protein